MMSNAHKALKTWSLNAVVIFYNSCLLVTNRDYEMSIITIWK